MNNILITQEIIRHIVGKKFKRSIFNFPIYFNLSRLLASETSQDMDFDK